MKIQSLKNIKVIINKGRCCPVLKLKLINKPISYKLKANKDMSRYTPDLKRYKMTQLNKSYEIRKMLTQITKAEINEEKKIKFSQSLESKFRKLEIRQNKDVIA